MGEAFSLEDYHIKLTNTYAPSTGRKAEEYREILFPEFDELSFWEWMQSCDKEQWLDLGCGLSPQHPNSLLQQAKKRGGPKITGVDPRIPFEKLEGLGLVARLGTRFIRWIGNFDPGLVEKGDWVAAHGEDLPFDDSSQDVVLSAFCFPYWLGDNPKVIKEIHRVLKPGGGVSRMNFLREAEKLKNVRDETSQKVRDSIKQEVIEGGFGVAASDFIKDNFNPIKLLSVDAEKCVTAVLQKNEKN